MKLYYCIKDKHGKDLCLINSDLILPNTDGMSFKQHCAEYDKAYAMSYEERIKAYAPAWCKQYLLDIVEQHRKYGFQITEFTNA